MPHILEKIINAYPYWFTVWCVLAIWMMIRDRKLMRTAPHTHTGWTGTLGGFFLIIAMAPVMLTMYFAAPELIIWFIKLALIVVVVIVLYFVIRDVIPTKK